VSHGAVFDRIPTRVAGGCFEAGVHLDSVAEAQSSAARKWGVQLPDF